MNLIDVVVLILIMIIIIIIVYLHSISKVAVNSCCHTLPHFYAVALLVLILNIAAILLPGR